jgi:hypothetical protein
MHRGRRFLCFAGTMAIALAAPSCGGGGGGGGDPSPGTPLSVPVPHFPVAQVGQAFSRPIAAQGGTPPYAYRLADASAPLPAGLSLSVGGVLSGTPLAPASSFFLLEVRDSAVPFSTAFRQIPVQVGGFDVGVAGLLAGAAWADTGHLVSTSTAFGAVTIEIGTTGSGALIQNADPTSGTATYVAGPVPGIDRLLLTRPNGAFTEIELRVRPNPTRSMVARPGTDVWHVDFEGKDDALHPYASDFHDALTRVGLRDPAALDAVGGKADALAEAYVRVETLRKLNVAFQNDADGDALPAGFSISFPWRRPLSPLLPGEGVATTSVPGGWNRVQVHSGNTAAAYGVPSWGWAIIDDPQNSHLENLGTVTAAAPFGVFVDQIATIFLPAFADTVLPAAPIGPADVPALEALLYGTPPDASPRAQEVARIAQNFARCLAMGTAHEIGHSLSLTHDLGFGWEIMDPATMPPAPGVDFRFSAPNATRLAAALPGPDR